jgi:hypothetical protein
MALTKEQRVSCDVCGSKTHESAAAFGLVAGEAGDRRRLDRDDLPRVFAARHKQVLIQGF